MKLGIILSVILLAFILLISVMLGLSPADSPTSLSSAEKLQKASLPADLPPLYISDNPNAVANEKYKAAFDFYRENKRRFDYGDAPVQFNDQLAALLIEGMKAERVVPPLFDNQMAMKPQGDTEFGDALEVVPGIAIQYALTLMDKGDDTYALQVCQAVFALGHRAFLHDTRKYPRQTGLGIMEDSGTLMARFMEKKPELEAPLNAWAKAITAINEKWLPKDQKIISVAKPPVADLIRVAREDQDPTFRVEATLTLGIAKFNAGHKGNLAAINEAIAELKNDPNPMVAQAAASAEAYTVEEMRRLR